MNPRTTPKDFFLHLGAAIALYASAIALLNLSFSVINYFLPDRLAGYFYAGSIAWPISMLFVLAPLLYVLEWLVGRDLARMPEKKELWIRKWRTYLTLFLAGAAIIGDLIALINIYLNGEITSRFVYKVLAVLIVSAVIFAYYILEKSAETRKTARKTLAWLGIVIVIAGIVGGFAAVGSPSKQRLLRADEQRQQNLFVIQSKIISYWTAYGSLPDSLAQADAMDPAPAFGERIKADPITDTPYEYYKKDANTYELCAGFSLSSDELKRSQGMPILPDTNLEMSWDHDVGRNCFTRTVDLNRYPLAPNPRSQMLK